MIGKIRTALTLNLIVAILVVVAYLCYGFLSGLHIDQRFLLWGPWSPGRGSGPRLPAWSFYAFFECIVLIAFFVSFYIKGDLGGHRSFCAVIGGFVLVYILFGWLQPVLQIMPPISDEGDILPRPTVASELPAFRSAVFSIDGCLALYVWGSHLLYGLFGIKDAQQRPRRS